MLDAVVITGVDGAIEYINESGALLFNKSISRILNLKSIFALGTFTPELKLQSKIDQGDRFQPYREYTVLVDDECKHVSLSIESQEKEGRSILVILIRDTTLEKRLYEKYHKELFEKSVALDQEMSQRVNLQLLATQLDRKVFETTCLLEFTHRARLISDSNHLFNEFIDFLTERFYFNGGLTLEENPEDGAIKIHTIKGIGNRRLAIETFQKVSVEFQRLHGQISYADVEHLAPVAQVWENLLNQVFSTPIGGLVFCPVSLESSRFKLVLFYSKAHHGLRSDDVELIRLLLNNMRICLENSSLKLLSITDELTGLFNRRYLKTSLIREVAKAQQTSTPLSAIVFDIDFFKKINDSHGHAGGDYVLKSVGGILKTHCRSGDLTFRYGGEEFVVLLPHTHLEEAKIFAERVRAELEALSLVYNEREIRVTISGGIASYPDTASDGDALIDVADLALYTAKNSGRNNIQMGSKVLRCG